MIEGHVWFLNYTYVYIYRIAQDKGQMIVKLRMELQYVVDILASEISQNPFKSTGPHTLEVNV